MKINEKKPASIDGTSNKLMASNKTSDRLSVNSDDDSSVSSVSSEEFQSEFYMRLILITNLIVNF